MQSLNGHLTLALALCLVLVNCAAPAATEEVVRRYPVRDIDGVVSREGVSFDAEITSDGNGSLRIDATAPTTVQLYEVGDIDVENARLLYRARIRTEGVGGQVFLEMWCRFPGLGEYFSRALHAPISGTTEWTTQETPFFLEPGQNPEEVKLNLAVAGSGTVWIDDIVLARGPR